MGDTGEVYERCPACEAVVRQGDSYCSACGESLPRAQGNYCRKCGAEFDRGDEYCSACGEARYPPESDDEVIAESDTVDRPSESTPSEQTEPSTAGESDPRDDSYVTHASDPDRSGDHEAFDETYSEYRSRVNHYLDHGWSIEQQKAEEVTLIKRNFGDFLTHLLLFVFTFFFTGGLVNLAYALYAYHVGAKRKQLVRGVPETRPVRESPDGSVRFSMYVFGLLTMLLSLLLLSGSGVSIAIGSVLLLLGTLVLPPVFDRVQRRKSISTFGVVTSTEDRTVENSPATCVVCGEETTNGLEREYKKERVVAGIPIFTVSSGTNRYCPSCGLDHALGNDRPGGAIPAEDTLAENEPDRSESVHIEDTDRSDPATAESYIDRELDAAEQSSAETGPDVAHPQMDHSDPGSDGDVETDLDEEAATTEGEPEEKSALLEEEYIDSADE